MCLPKDAPWKGFVQAEACFVSILFPAFPFSIAFSLSLVRETGGKMSPVQVLSGRDCICSGSSGTSTRNDITRAGVARAWQKLDKACDI